MRMILPLVAAVIPLFNVPALVQGSRAPAPVFDGRSFNGWEGNRAIFRIEDGAIVGGSLREKIAKNEFLCTTASYSDFELRLRVRLLGGSSANAGVQFRTRRIPNNTRSSVTRPTSARTTGVRCTTNRDGRRRSTRRTMPSSRAWFGTLTGTTTWFEPRDRESACG